MTEILFLISSFFEAYILSRYMNIFFENKVVDEKFILIMYGFRILVGEITNFVVHYPLINLFQSIITVFLIVICYEATIFKKFIVTAIVFMCLFISEAIVALVVNISGFSIYEESDNGNIIGVISSLFILWMLTIVLKKIIKKRDNMPVSIPITIAIIVVPTVSVFMEILIFQQRDLNSKVRAMSVICVMAMNFIMFYLYDNIANSFEEKTKTELAEREKTYYHEQTNLLQNNYEEIRNFRHDTKNHLFVLEGMIEQSENEQALNYISNLTDKLEVNNIYSKTGNVALDSVSNYKLTTAYNKGIDINAKIISPIGIPIEDDDIVIILGNLFDNAIEANEKIKKNRYIDFQFLYEKENIYIKIKNSFDGVVEKTNKRISTRKKNKMHHGIGLKNISEIVEKYKGEININYEGNEFEVNVFLFPLEKII